jgi:hypothetical protein
VASVFVHEMVFYAKTDVEAAKDLHKKHLQTKKKTKIKTQ